MLQEHDSLSTYSTYGWYLFVAGWVGGARCLQSILNSGVIVAVGAAAA
jgi:hypothetical protein